MMLPFIIEAIDLHDPIHCANLTRLLDAYMSDDMGAGKPMPQGSGLTLITGLQEYNGYLGFLIKEGDHYFGIANCIRSFSTFRAAPILNLHDFFIEKAYRASGAAKVFLEYLISYARENSYTKMTLEVREDNHRAQALYRKYGFGNGTLKMFFWEHDLNPQP